MFFSCPIPECKMAIPPHIIEEVLNDEQYERYERLVLEVRLLTLSWKCQNTALCCKDCDQSLWTGRVTTCLEYLEMSLREFLKWTKMSRNFNIWFLCNTLYNSILLLCDKTIHLVCNLNRILVRLVSVLFFRYQWM